MKLYYILFISTILFFFLGFNFFFYNYSQKLAIYGYYLLDTAMIFPFILIIEKYFFYPYKDKKNYVIFSLRPKEFIFKSIISLILNRHFLAYLISSSLLFMVFLFNKVSLVNLFLIFSISIIIKGLYISLTKIVKFKSKNIKVFANSIFIFLLVIVFVFNSFQTPILREYLIYLPPSSPLSVIIEKPYSAILSLSINFIFLIVLFLAYYKNSKYWYK